MRRTHLLTTASGLAAGLFLGWLTGVVALGGGGPLAAGDQLPRFTTEREAAARHFVQKNLPELLPLLDQLKKNNAAQYEKEVRSIFQLTELLADLLDEPRRHDLELKIWKAENRANTLVAKLSVPSDTERKLVTDLLRDLARELVELDIQVLELRAEQLDKELGEVKDELTKSREQVDKQVDERYMGLLHKIRKPGR